MPLFILPSLRIAGISAAVPANVEENADYPWATPKEGEMFMKTVGVERRHIAPPHLTAADLCEAAARKLLDELGWKPEEIGVLVLVTQTPDYRIPATSTILQHKLGLSQNCMAIDVNLGCSGYVYGLSILGSLLAGTGAEKGLLLVGDCSSKVVSKADKSVAPLFADAGSATALQTPKNGGFAFTFNLKNNGAGYNAIIIPDGGLRNPATPASFERKTVEPGIERCGVDMILDGLGVFNFSLTEVAPNVTELWAHLGKTAADYDYAIFHQANRLMNESVRKKLKLSPEQVPYSLRDYGNTSSATIPVTLVSQLADTLRKDRLRLIFSGFGVGLSWGCVDLQTDGIVVPEILKV